MDELLKKPEEVRRIRPYPDPGRFLEDLEELRVKALKSGAETAEIIKAGDISISAEVLERVGADIDYPSIHWPAFYPRDDFEPALRAYDSGILFGVGLDTDMPGYRGGPISDPGHVRTYRLVYELAALIESASFYRGYHLAMGFAVGNCRAVFCAGEKSCRAAIKGRACLHPYRARPSLEAMGLTIDPPGDRPAGGLYGLVLVA